MYLDIPCEDIDLCLSKLNFDMSNECIENSNLLSAFFNGKKRCRFPFTFVRNPLERFISGER